MEDLCEQSYGMVAFRNNASYLPNRLTHVTPGLYSLLQKHNKKLFDMCNLGEEFLSARISEQYDLIKYTRNTRKAKLTLINEC